MWYTAAARLCACLYTRHVASLLLAAETCGSRGRLARVPLRRGGGGIQFGLFVSCCGNADWIN